MTTTQQRPAEPAFDLDPAVLVLEDGRTFRGQAYGARGHTVGEAVFSTGMTGYQETLTDPSYHKQVVVMTAPHVGNTGVNDEDDESARIWVAGYVVRDPAVRPSSWRSRRTLDDELDRQGVVGISGIDTRALTRHLRERGAMRVGIFSGDRAQEPVTGLLEARIPFFGICFGNQLLGRALGFGTYKLKYGHRGINQPVMDKTTGKVEVTAHNHGFAVDAPTDGDVAAPGEGTAYGRVRVSHVCLNDGVVEGLECLDLPAYSVQYHPEAAAGPHDAAYLFDRFVAAMEASPGRERSKTDGEGESD